MKKQNHLICAFLAAALTASLAGCGSHAKESAMAVAETSAGNIQNTDYAGLGSAPQIHPQSASNKSEAFTKAEETGDMQNISKPENRKLIRTVYLTMETTEFDSLLESLSQTVSQAGGYIESSSISGSSILDSQENRRYASLTVRIPSPQLDAFLSQIGNQGNVTNRSESTEDITLQYSDLESRKKTLLLEQDRLWDLLSKADSVDAVIALESRLSEIRYQLESMESQLRTYDNQVDYSSVHIDLSEVKVFTSTSPDSVGMRIQKGFQKNLKAVASGLVNAFVLITSSLPILFTIGLLLALAWFLFRFFFRKGAHWQKKKNSSKTQEKSDS